MSGSRHKEQGRRPSSAGWWSQPWALLDEMLCMQYFTTVIVCLSVVRETQTQNTESQVDAAELMLSLPFWVSQLWRGGGVGWFQLTCACRWHPSSQCFSWEEYSLPQQICQVLSDKIYKAVKHSLLNPCNDPAAKPDTTFLMSVLCQVMYNFRGKAKAFPSGEISEWAIGAYHDILHPGLGCPNLMMRWARGSCSSLLPQQVPMFSMPPFLSNRCLGREEEEGRGEKEGKKHPVLGDSGVTCVKCHWGCQVTCRQWNSMRKHLSNDSSWNRQWWQSFSLLMGERRWRQKGLLHHSGKGAAATGLSGTFPAFTSRHGNSFPLPLPCQWFSKGFESSSPHPLNYTG